MTVGNESSPIIRTGWTIGSSSAEHDRDLYEVFIDTGSFDSLNDVEDRRSLLVGRTGAGKSASLSQIENRRARQAIRIRPQDFAFQYITNTDMVKRLKDLDVELSPFFRALWQHVLVVEILNHEYGIQNNDDKRSAFERIRTSARSTRATQTALEYLDEFGSDFWEPAHVRMRQIAENFEGRVFGGSAAIKLGNSSGFGTHGEISVNDTTREERESRERYQSQVARSLAPKMSEITRIIDEVVLSNDRSPLFVLIDDLDLDWSDDEIRIDLIRCLFDAILELQKRVRNLKILVALRTNIFGQLGYEQSRFHQMEKILDATQMIDWSRHELRALVETRLDRLTRRNNLAVPLSLETILPSYSALHGDAFNWILDRTLLRPRDVIVWMNEILRLASGRSGIDWTDLLDSERVVSQNRLDSLRDDWQDPYMGIDKVLGCFHQRRSRLTVDEYMELVRRDVAPLIYDDSIRSGDWLEPCLDGLLGNSPNGNEYWFHDFDPITEILWKVGFLGVAQTDGSVAIYSSNADTRWNSKLMVTPASTVEVHQMYRSALDMLV